MSLYKTTISQVSNFSTKLKGDTLFGQLCWMIVFKYSEDRLKKLLNYYEDRPFLVVSDAFATRYLPKPKMPSIYLNEKSEDKKENRKKIWLTLKDLQNGKYQNAKKNDEIGNKDSEIESMHNSLNYKTFHTDSDTFAPYALKDYKYSPKDIYFYINEKLFSLGELKEIFKLLSEYGYGKDTTLGKGRFTFSDFEKVEFNLNSKTVMTLSPLAIKDIKAKRVFYEPFVRFGKFGANRAYKNAFKKPIILADTASVLEFEEKVEKPFVGKALKDFADTYKDSVHQGYTIVVPIKDLS